MSDPTAGPNAMAPAPAAPLPIRNVILFVAIALGGAAFDLATKSYIFARVGEPSERRIVTVVPNVIELQTSYNRGALWGFMRDMPGSSKMFAGLSVVAVALIVVWLFAGRAIQSAWLTVALGLITAGALGNCYDRLVFNHVRDFVHLHIDPIQFDCAIFNFADNMLVVGAVTLVLMALRPEPGPAGVEADAPAPGAAVHTS